MATPKSVIDINNWQRNNQRRVPYSESDYRRLMADVAHQYDPTDCSGMAARMMKRFAGLTIGTYTGNECTYGHLVTVSKSVARTGYGMLPCDLVFFDWDGQYRNGEPWDHVAIYAGGGRMWNHGGPGYGPIDESLMYNVDDAVRVMVRRPINWPANTVTHPPVRGNPANPMHNKPIPALITRGTGDFYGLESDPRNESHGGFYPSEQPAVKLIEQFLAWKYPVAAKERHLVVDGHFGPVTKELVTAFQHQYMPGTEFFGQVWFDDWAKMASL